MAGLTLLDVVALGWFLACWLGYNLIADHSRWAARSMTAAMNRHRRRWFREMLDRDVRIVDTQILGNLLTGIGFFASTTIILVGGFVALLGAADQATEALSNLPLVDRPSRTIWELKVLLMIAIFIYAFFKFAWAFRLSNYCAILIGAAPQKPESEAAAELYAEKLATVHSRVAHHFNRGLRAYFFALGALGWFLHPVLLIAATAGVVLVLYRREFSSRVLQTVREMG